jgi:hypothetical protein
LVPVFVRSIRFIKLLMPVFRVPRITLRLPFSARPHEKTS